MTKYIGLRRSFVGQNTTYDTLSESCLIAIVPKLPRFGIIQTRSFESAQGRLFAYD